MNDLDTAGRLRSAANWPETAAAPRLLLDAADALERLVAAVLAVRERVTEADTPLNVAADIEQVICEIGGVWDVPQP